MRLAPKYMNIFAKAWSLSPFVLIRMSHAVPVVVEYRLANLSNSDVDAGGYVRFYLAPKIEDMEADSERDAEEG